VNNVETVGETFGFAVDHDVDRSLRPARHVLAAMPRGGPEAQRAEHRGQRFGFFVAGGEFDEFDARWSSRAAGGRGRRRRVIRLPAGAARDSHRAPRRSPIRRGSGR
jgi:hypothetical protein